MYIYHIYAVKNMKMSINEYDDYVIIIFNVSKKNSIEKILKFVLEGF